MKRKAIAWAALMFLILPAAASALALQSFNAEFVVADDSAVITYYLVPEESGQLELNLPGNISGLSVSSSEGKVPFQFKAADRQVSLQAVAGKELKVSFVSGSSVETGASQRFFVFNFSPGSSVSQATAKLVLPEGALLASAAEEGSVVPSPESISSDGRQLEINWTFDGEETVFVSFIPQTKFNLLWLVIPLSMLIVLGGAAAWFLKFKAKAKPSLAKTEAAKEEEEELDLRGLTPEEKAVVTALHKSSEKQLTQSRLKDLTGLQKVKLSRVIARLEKRGTVGKRPYGNTNLVFLEKKAG